MAVYIPEMMRSFWGLLKYVTSVHPIQASFMGWGRFAFFSLFFFFFKSYFASFFNRKYPAVRTMNTQVMPAIC